jgi:hypothetical protein
MWAGNLFYQSRRWYINAEQGDGVHPAILVEATMNDIETRSEGIALWILMMLVLMVPWALFH